MRVTSLGIVLATLIQAGCSEAPAKTAISLPATQPDSKVQVAAGEQNDAGVTRISNEESAPESLARAVVDDEQQPDATAERTHSESLRAGFDWPIFLGLHGNGVSDETGLLDEWPETGPPVLWDKRIGTGYSSPSIRKNTLVIHHRLRDKDIIEGVKADDGSPLWRYEYDTDYADPYGYNNGPRCSPVLTDSLCYTYGAQGRLVCLDLETGKLIWERDTAKEWNVPTHFFGAGCTPILEGGLLIVLIGGQPNSGVVALDPKTGETRWESVGKDTWDGAQIEDTERRMRWTNREMLISYSSPIAATIHNQRHVLCLVRQGLVSLDPADGRVRFKYWFRSRTHPSVNAARPVVIGDEIFLSAAYETGMALLKVHADSNGYDVVWRNPTGMSTHWSTAQYRDGCIFGFNGRHEYEATLQCIDVATGDLVWETSGNARQIKDPIQGLIFDSETGTPVRKPDYGRGSATYAEGKYYIQGEFGILALAKLDRTGWKEISRTSYPQLKYPMWASPVLSRGRVYLRSESWLICIDVAKHHIPTASKQ